MAQSNNSVGVEDHVCKEKKKKQIETLSTIAAVYKYPRSSALRVRPGVPSTGPRTRKSKELREENWSTDTYLTGHLILIKTTLDIGQDQ